MTGASCPEGAMRCIAHQQLVHHDALSAEYHMSPASSTTFGLGATLVYGIPWLVSGAWCRLTESYAASCWVEEPLLWMAYLGGAPGHCEEHLERHA